MNKLANKFADKLVSRLQESMDELVDSRVDHLLERVLKAPSTSPHHRELDNTALDEPGHLPISSQSSCCDSDMRTIDVLTDSCSYCCSYSGSCCSQSALPARRLSSKSYFGMVEGAFSWCKDKLSQYTPSYISQSVKDLLGYLGLSDKKGKMLFLGLDNAGKTTLVQMLKTNMFEQYEPTMYPSSEYLIVGNLKFKAFDLGGHEMGRQVWKDYFVAVD